MKKYKLLIIIFILFILISISFFTMTKLKSNNNDISNNKIINMQNTTNNITTNKTSNILMNTDINNNVVSNTSSVSEEMVLENAIKEQNLSGKKELYELVETDYGKDVAIVKNDLQFLTIWTGIQKKSKPNINELEDYSKQIPNNNGIWIKEDSRNNFLLILKEAIGNDVFYIDNNGYLQINEKSDIKDEYGYVSRLKKAINSNYKIIVAIRSSHYLIDTSSGEIYEEEFEKLSPETPLIFYRENDSAIILLSTNKENKITNEAYLESFLNCCE